MELLQSKKFKLPKVMFVSKKEDIKKLPIGTPYIFGDEVIKPHVIKLLEYEILYQSAKRSGYPFDFKRILRDNGYNIKDFHFDNPAFMNYKTDDGYTKEITLSKEGEVKVCNPDKFEEFVKDSASYVDLDVLKELKVFPVWYDSVADAVSTNINAYATFDTNMYNKKLGLMTGGLAMKSPAKNVIIIDISGSIPKGVSSTCLALAKNLSESFHADLVITGSKTTLYPYEELDSLDVRKLYDENGMGNDQAYFRKMVSTKAVYNTAIVFGDNHSPSHDWYNEYNHNTKKISIEDGKEECQWEINKLVSLHTSNTKKESHKDIAGYGQWFEPKEIEHIDDWTKYL